MLEAFPTTSTDAEARSAAMAAASADVAPADAPEGEASNSTSADDATDPSDTSETAPDQAGNDPAVEPADGGADAGPEGGEVASADSPEPPKPAAPQRLSKAERQAQYKAEQAKRYKRAADRKFAEVNSAFSKIQELEARINDRERKLEERERHVASFEDELRRDTAGTLHRRLGISPEQLLAEKADAQAMPPAVIARIEAAEKRAADVAAALEKRDKDLAEREAKQAREAQDREFMQRQRAAFDEDVKDISNVDSDDLAEEWQYLAALEPGDRNRLVRAELMRGLQAGEYERDTPIEEVRDRCDEIAKPRVEYTEKRRLARLDRAQGTRAKPNGQAKAPGRASARAAAEPADRRELTDAELREAAIRVARDEMRVTRH